MRTEQLIDDLELLAAKHKDDKYFTFETRWIDVLEAVINKLKELDWHTGTPTEEGRYLIENIGRYNEILEWYNGHWYEEDPNSVDCRCKVSDSWVVAWYGQKIEPYKEKEDAESSFYS